MFLLNKIKGNTFYFFKKIMYRQKIIKVLKKKSITKCFKKKKENKKNQPNLMRK